MSVEYQVSYYENLLDKYGENHYLSMDWKSPESQKLRFGIFEHLFGIAGKGRDFSVLDVGCGFGDFFEFLKKRGYRFNYKGYDVSPRVVEAARKKHPQANFEVKNILTDLRPERFDYVFSSGVFNIRFYSEEEHLEMVKTMLLKMFEISRVGAGANFLSTGAVYYVKEEELNSGRYFYFKPEYLVGYCKSFCSRFMLRHDYHPGDFTIFLLR